MKTFTYLKALLSFLLFVLITNNAFSQSGAASPTPFTNASAHAVSLTGSQTNSSRKFIAPTSWGFLSGPQTITPGATTLSSGSNNNTANATASFPSGAAAGTYTFRLSYTVTTNSGGSSSTTGTLDVTVTVTTPPAPPNPIGCDGKFFVSYTPSGGGGSFTHLDSLQILATITANEFVTNNSTANITFNGIGISPIDGFLYGVSDAGDLIKVGRNPSGVAPHIILNMGALSPSPSSTVYAGCFDKDGNFYYVYGTSFRKITAAAIAAADGINPIPSTALTSLNGSGDNAPASGTFIVDIAINPIDGLMYGVSASVTSNTTASYRLYKIDIATGALTRLGAPGSGTTGQYPNSGNFIAALFFTEDGSLYGYRGDGQFYKMDLVNPQSSPNIADSGGKTYSQADGCSCSFGRVYHELNVGNAAAHIVCPSVPTPHPVVTLTVNVVNQSIAQQTLLTYTLLLPGTTFSFNQSATTIATNMFTAGVITTNTPGSISITSVGGGTNNQLVVTGNNFQTGPPTTTKTFTLDIVTNSSSIVPVSLQSVISGLPATLGSTDLSNDAFTALPDDPTVLTFCEQAPLPVKLLSFSGAYKDDVASINWEVENQVNFAYYDLERSTDGSHFSSIVIKQAQRANNSSKQQYQHLDDLSLESSDVFYYRLRMVDIDGSAKYSNVVMIRKDLKSTQGISIVPNPVSNNMATLRFTATTTGTAEIKIINMAGKLVLNQRNNVYEGINSLSINNLSTLQAGTYLLQVINDQDILNSKFVITRY